MRSHLTYVPDLLACGGVRLRLLLLQLAALDAALMGLGEYSHVAFTSKNGIMAVLERLEGLLGGHAGVVNHIRRSGVQLAALGADGRVLEDYGLQVGHARSPSMP
jgi:uroporphyrinogen-III synthase